MIPAMQSLLSKTPEGDPQKRWSRAYKSDELVAAGACV